MSVYYVKNPVDNNDASRVVVNAGDITMVTDEKSNHAWQYNSDGEFTMCYVQEMSKTNAMAKVSESTSVVVDNGVPVVRFNVGGDARLLKISTIKFDAEARAESARILSPNSEQCYKARSQVRRRALSEISECGGGLCNNIRNSGYTAKELWKATQASYKDPSAEGNTGNMGACADTNILGDWRCVEVYENENARAALLVHNGKYVVSISGTDGITAFQDWSDNLNKKKVLKIFLVERQIALRGSTAERCTQDSVNTLKNSRN